MAARFQPWKIAVDFVEIGIDFSARNAAGICARQQIFFDSQVRKTMAAFHYLDDTALHQVGRGELVNFFTAIFDRALGDVATLAAKQVRHRA